ncbi:MAG: PIN domain-containing protein [Synergistaceae bacterium]|nr:PIN domain-containing protein [Synergistaceae bacterium]
MDIFIDTNVILNYITGRDDPFLDSSIRIIKLCSQKKLNGYVAFHSIPIIWYALRKKPEYERRCWLKELCEILTIVSATHEQVVEAIDNIDFQDFEDCLQDQCAVNAGVDYIVTCNVKDFENSEVRSINPDEFLLTFLEA